jgi:heme/copper-type cytochrome/quinol oxidase subunit 2
MERVDDLEKPVSFDVGAAPRRSTSSLGAMLPVAIQFALIIFLPAIISAGSGYIGGSGIARPWLYFLVTTVVLYVVYVAIFYALAETISGGFAISRHDPTSSPQVRSSVPNLIAFYAKPLAVFIVAAIPAVIGLNKLFHRL